MAAKFVVGLALIAVCHSNPLFLNGAPYPEHRSAYSIGKAYGVGQNTAEANVNRDFAQAYSSSNGGTQLSRNGYYNPAGIAQAQAYNGPDRGYAAAEANNGAYVPNNLEYPTEYFVPATAKSSAASNGIGQASASSAVQSNDIVGVGPTQDLTIIDAKTPMFYNTYLSSAPAQGVASSNANVVGNGRATSSAQVTNGKTISWRFGTLYDLPNTYSGNSAVKSAAYNNGYGSSSARSNVNGSGSAKSSADTGNGSAKSYAITNGNMSGFGNGVAESAAQIHGSHYGGKAIADARGYGSASAAAKTY